MAISVDQIKLVQEFRKRLREELKEYNSAPKEVQELMDELWQTFKEEAAFTDDNQADLAAFGLRHEKRFGLTDWQSALS